MSAGGSQAATDPPAATGCPVDAFAIPPRAGVLVAWDGSREAVAALAALVSNANRRHFIIAAIGDARPSADDAAAWLVAHGSTVQLERLPRRDASRPLQAVCRSTRPGRCLASRLCDRTVGAGSGHGEA